MWNLWIYKQQEENLVEKGEKRQWLRRTFRPLGFISVQPKGRNYKRSSQPLSLSL